MFRIILYAVLFASLFLNACSDVEGQPPGLANKAPDFTLETLEGQKFNLADTLKAKDAVLVFWTTWCPVCVREIPNVERFYRAEGGSVAVLGINLQESKAKVSAFVEKKRISYPIALDTYGSVGQLYKVRGIPTVIAVNKEGNVIYRGHDIRRLEEIL